MVRNGTSIGGSLQNCPAK